jgi:tetratricopeptide (TPR) repeat protein
MANLGLEQLKRLPQRSAETWQGGIVRMPFWITGEARRPYRSYAAVWAAVTDATVSPPEVFRPEEMSFDKLLSSLVKFATDPQIGGYRPGRVEVRDAALADYLQTRLSDLGIPVVCKDELPALDEALANLVEYLVEGPLPPGALTGPGVTVEAMRRYAEAAKALFEAKPWKHLTDEDLLQIESPAAPTGLKYASILGAGGQTFGLGFYDEPKECWAIRQMEDPTAWFASRTRGVWNMTFGDITELPFGDADLWEDHNLPVAADNAYPCAMCSKPQGGVDRPDAAIMAFLESLMLALARSTEEQIDSGRWSIKLESAGGPVEVRLALPDLLNPPNYKELRDRGFPPDRRSMEQMHAQIGRLMEGENFSGTEEMNAMLQREFMGKAIDPDRFPPRNALERAQNLCYQAFDAIGRRQFQLARQALAICPDCADAYVLLAERTSDGNEAMELFAQGVAAGERALGKERFEEDAGHFWGVVDTRPYMRARFGLAQCLAKRGQIQEAVEHYRELLRLNPGDNQGVRYLFLPLLLKMGRDEEAARFMKESADEPSANWTYTRALLVYRLGGNCPAAQAEIHKALKANAHVPAYLLADENPEPLPDSYSPGSREEAAICAAELRSAFGATPGAVQWLESQARLRRQMQRTKERKLRKSKRRR